MAQTGFTPIQIYSSSTAAVAPVAGNLTNSALGSELAINITDGKLFYKDNANAIQVIAWKVTPTSAGGTGLTSYAAGDLLFYASGTALSKLTIGASATVLTSSGSAPQWTAQSALSVGTAANLLSNATTGVMQVTGPGTGTTRVMTIPNANFTAARTDAAQSFTGIQTFNASIGVGGVPSPWAANRTVVEVSGNTVSALALNSSIVEIYANGYWNGTNDIYKTNGPAAWWNFNNQSSGGWALNTAASGTAGGTISWTRLITTDSSSNVTVNTGNLVIGTSGKGIDFSATPGTGTSELLADYEEGTWTPVLTASTSGTITSTDRAGRYTKIGRTVVIEGYINIASVSSPVGDLRITGLPFNIQNSAPGAGSAFVYGFANLPAATAIQMFAQGGLDYAVIRGFLNGTQVTGYAANAQSSAGMQFSLVYSV